MKTTSGRGREAVDFCRFMMMSGARVGEVALTAWKHVDWERKHIHIPGCKSATSDRYVPPFSAVERSEAGGTVTLNSLRKAAAAMDCEVVYAIVSRTSLDAILERKALA